MSDTTHSSGPSPAGSDDHGDHDIASHLKTYLAVFAALLVGTVVTVSLYYVHFESMALTIAIALFIASIKSFLVAGYFMHLLTEKKVIYGIMAVTVVFFFALGGLTLWGTHDLPAGSEAKALYVP